MPAAAAPSVEAYLASLVDTVEGGAYTSDPADRGGPTRWGITQATLAKWRGTPVTPEQVKNLTRDEALAIYRAQYVTVPGFDKIADISVPVALEVIDTGVNMGPQQATRYLQRSLNVLNLTGNAWPVLLVDGQCGRRTAAAMQGYMAQRGPRGAQVLVTALNSLQGCDYVQIAEANPSQKKFVYGWLNQRMFQNLSDWACRA